MNSLEEKLRAGLVKLALLPARALRFVDVEKHPALKTPARWVALYSAYFAISARGEERFQQDVDQFFDGLPAYFEHMEAQSEQLQNEACTAYIDEAMPVIARARAEGWDGDIERLNAQLDLIFERHRKDEDEGGNPGMGSIKP